MAAFDRPRWSIAKKRLGALALSVTLTACGGGSSSPPGAEPFASQERASSSAANLAATPLAASPQGRLLASNCFQCHGTNGNGGFEEIRGKSAEELLEFLQKPAGKDIMAAHAQGYTPAQLKTIAAYLQR
jgi:mono/diheme cytochrome c family protein